MRFIFFLRCIFSSVLPPVSLYPIMLHMPRISQPKPSPWWENNAEIAVGCELVHVEVHVELCKYYVYIMYIHKES